MKRIRVTATKFRVEAQQQTFPVIEEMEEEEELIPKEDMDTQFYDANKEHLFHGTILDYKGDILELGLIPQLGKFVEEMYGGEYSDFEEDLEELLGEYTYAADLDGLKKSLNAIIFQIAQKLDKTFHDVTAEDIRNHGILFIIEFGKREESMEQRPQEDDPYEEYPSAVEPGDYYSNEVIGIDYYLEGQELIDFYKRYQVWYKDIEGSKACGRSLELTPLTSQQV